MTKKLGFVGGLAFLLAACGSHPAVSALQKFDRLRPQMKKTTRTSRTVATDLTFVGRAMQGDNVRWARHLAVRLKADAHSLVRLATLVRHKIALLATKTHTTAAHQYLKLAVGTLTWQVREGNILRHLADLVWSDPVLLSPRDEYLLWRMSRAADWSAWNAVLTSRQMSHWKKTHASQLRYQPVK